MLSHSSSNADVLATKQSAIVGGQTSCKAPEIAAFEKHLPEDVDIVSCHSLHGPNVDPKGQPLVSKACDLTLLILTHSLGTNQASRITREL
jgi:prephenate dehydrogenase